MVRRADRFSHAAMLSSGGEPRFSKAARRRYWQPQLTVTTPVARLSVLSTTVACGSDPAQ